MNAARRRRGRPRHIEEAILVYRQIIALYDLLIMGHYDDDEVLKHCRSRGLARLREIQVGCHAAGMQPGTME